MPLIRLARLYTPLKCTGCNKSFICTCVNHQQYYFQALPQVTVLVGKRSEGNMCRILTLAESVDDPKFVEFPVPSAETPLTPGSPKWANYVKGVVANYIGWYL